MDPDAYYLTFCWRDGKIYSLTSREPITPEEAEARFVERFGVPAPWKGLRGGYYCMGPIPEKED